MFPSAILTLGSSHFTQKLEKHRLNFYMYTCLETCLEFNWLCIEFIDQFEGRGNFYNLQYWAYLPTNMILVPFFIRPSAFSQTCFHFSKRLHPPSLEIFFKNLITILLTYTFSDCTNNHYLMYKNLFNFKKGERKINSSSMILTI